MCYRTVIELEAPFVLAHVATRFRAMMEAPSQEEKKPILEPKAACVFACNLVCGGGGG